MHFPAPLAVPVEIRALDTGAAVERCFRLAEAIGEQGLALERPVPFAPGRPVQVDLRLPDGSAVTVRGVLERTGPRREADEGAPPASNVVVFRDLTDDARQRVAAYVEERTSIP